MRKVTDRYNFTMPEPSDRVTTEADQVLTDLHNARARGDDAAESAALAAWEALPPEVRQEFENHVDARRLALMAEAQANRIAVEEGAVQQARAQTSRGGGNARSDAYNELRAEWVAAAEVHRATGDGPHKAAGKIVSQFATRGRYIDHKGADIGRARMTKRIGNHLEKVWRKINSKC